MIFRWSFWCSRDWALWMRRHHLAYKLFWNFRKSRISRQLPPSDGQLHLDHSIAWGPKDQIQDRVTGTWNISAIIHKLCEIVYWLLQLQESTSDPNGRCLDRIDINDSGNIDYGICGSRLVLKNIFYSVHLNFNSWYQGTQGKRVSSPLATNSRYRWPPTNMKVRQDSAPNMKFVSNIVFMNEK